MYKANTIIHNILLFIMLSDTNCHL